MQRLALALIGFAGVAFWVFLLWWAFGPFGTGDTWTKACCRSQEYIGIDAVQQTLDGGYVLAGFTQAFAGGPTDIFLVKLDARGDEQWSKVFGERGFEWAYAVEETSDGGYALAGNFTAGAHLMKIDATGDKVWSKTYPELGLCQAMEQTSDGGYVLTGFWQDESPPHECGIYVVKTDAEGKVSRRGFWRD